MNMLTGDLRRIFFQYLRACLFSALVVSAYSLIDCIMVGQYEGPLGTAALATVMPVWNIILSLGLLMGIGGSVLMSAARGAGDAARGRKFFTVAATAAAAVTLLVWLIFLFFDAPLLRLFGADDTLLPLARRYVFYIKMAIPQFMLGQALSAFVRNDGAPQLASASVIAGGVLNIIGDYYFVFVRDMGISGAGLATAIGQTVGFAILCSHFFSRRCTLGFARPTLPLPMLRQVLQTGFPTFVVDVAMGILTLLFNRQIMRYFGSDVLAIYGVITNVAMTVQAVSYSVGQAAQPILSQNYGAGLLCRISRIRAIAIATAFALSLLCFALTMLFPTQLTALFMDATPAVLALAPGIMRVYFLSFTLMGFNIFATYYFQAVLRPGLSLGISLLRSVALSSVLTLALPPLLGADALWWVMPVTEAVTAAVVLPLLRKNTQTN